jgi:hypothetical protein
VISITSRRRDADVEMLHADGRFQSRSGQIDILRAPAHGNNLVTIVMVEMLVLGRDDRVVIVMLNKEHFLEQTVFVVAINHDDGTRDETALIMSLPDQIANRFGPVP